MKLPLRVFEVGPDGRTTRLLEAGTSVAEGQHLDEVLRAARSLLEARGRVVRSVSAGSAEIVAVVHGPGVRKDPRTMRESDRRYG